MYFHGWCYQSWSHNLIILSRLQCVHSTGTTSSRKEAGNWLENLRDLQGTPGCCRASAERKTFHHIHCACHKNCQLFHNVVCLLRSEVAHRLPHTVSCVCAHSAPESNTSILFSQIWELQNFIFLGSRSWQKCKCNIPDGENVHADSMYPWGSFHWRGSLLPATAAVCLDKIFWHSKLTAWIRLGILADLHYPLALAQSLPSLIVMTFREVEFKKMTPILRELQSSETFAWPAWNESLSCSAIPSRPRRLPKASLWSVNRDRQRRSRCWTSNDVSLQKRRPKASTDDRQAHENCSFL